MIEACSTRARRAIPGHLPDLQETVTGRSSHVTLIDQRNYHQLKPLLCQVATSQLAATDIAASLRKAFTAMTTST